MTERNEFYKPEPIGAKIVDIAQPAPPVADADMGVKPDKVIEIPEEATKAPELSIRVCPACSARLDEDDNLIVDVEDKIRWIRYICGEKRFTKKYTLFGGILELTFRSLFTSEMDAVLNQLTKEVNAGSLGGYPAYASPAYISRMHRLLTVMSIQKVEYKKTDKIDVPLSTVYPDVTPENYKETATQTYIQVAHDAILNKLGAGLAVAITTAYRHFDTLTAILVRNSESSDFWDPIGT